MNRSFNSFFSIFLSLFFTGCAVGPLVIHETARSVGPGNHEITVAAGQAGYAAKLNYGLGQNLDLGFQLETLSVGVRLKYALLNQQTAGFSIATAAGLGDSAGGNHYYADVIASYLSGSIEPYVNLRAVHVRTDPTSIRSSNSALNFTVNSTQYQYGQAMLGARLLLGKVFFVSGEASSLFSLKSSGVSFGKSQLFGGAVGVRF